MPRPPLSSHTLTTCLSQLSLHHDLGSLESVALSTSSLSAMRWVAVGAGAAGGHHWRGHIGFARRTIRHPPPLRTLLAPPHHGMYRLMYMYIYVIGLPAPRYVSYYTHTHTHTHTHAHAHAHVCVCLHLCVCVCVCVCVCMYVISLAASTVHRASIHAR